MRKRLLVLLLLTGWMSAAVVSAKIELPEIVGDNMVLQQQTEARLWGTAQAGAIVSVKAIERRVGIIIVNTIIGDKDSDFATNSQSELVEMSKIHV